MMKFDILAQFIALELGRAKRAKNRYEHEKAQPKSLKREFLDVRALLEFSAELSSDERIYAAPTSLLGYANYRIASDCRSRDRALRLKPEVWGKTPRFSESNVIVKRQVNKIYRENLGRCGLRFRSEAGDLTSASRANGYEK